jgi:hypothetical protein
MNNISKRKIIINILVIYSILICLLYYKLPEAIKILDKKSVNKNFCAIGNNFNDDIIELLTTATKSDIKLIIVEPQRLVQYLSEEELVLFRKSDNSPKFETIFSPNKFVFGVFESDFNSSRIVKYF